RTFTALGGLRAAGRPIRGSCGRSARGGRFRGRNVGKKGRALATWPAGTRGGTCARFDRREFVGGGVAHPRLCKTPSGGLRPPHPTRGPPACWPPCPLARRGRCGQTLYPTTASVRRMSDHDRGLC